jgi:sRNA-binding carbon storage regulator CsrA
MLTITRKKGQAVFLTTESGERIVIIVSEIRHNSIQFRIGAPASVIISRDNARGKS